MKQQGNSINPGNIQHFADSAKNAIQLGQRQFFTPPPLATALVTPFRHLATSIATDLMAGSGHLLTAAARPISCGIDVDERSASLTNVYQADVTRFYPLARAAGLTHDLLLLNPPFSLQWYLDRLTHLADSDAVGVKAAYATALAAGPTIDSTLATFLIALDSLSRSGEGMMICNADTARRLIGDPQAAAPTDLLQNVWAWLDIPGAVYENQHSAFPTAVIYFSHSHGQGSPEDRLPLYLHSPSADPDTVTKTLATAISARPFAYCGRSITSDYQAQTWKDDHQLLWDAVRREYHQLHHGAKPKFNLLLNPQGRITTFLDPFRRAAYRHDRLLLLAFQEMSGKTPASLVVQQASRAALKHAITSGAWRVEPALIAAVHDAIAAYEAVRAPFYCPGEVQSLGWLDEESEIPCSTPGIPGFRVGSAYPIRTWIEDTTWGDKKMNLKGELEKLELSGRELVVEILDDDARPHHFHVRRPKKREGPALQGRAATLPTKRETDAEHHHIQSLIDHFTIPTPRDVAQTNPAAYQENLRRLDILEAHVNAA